MKEQERPSFAGRVKDKVSEVGNEMSTTTWVMVGAFFIGRFSTDNPYDWKSISMIAGIGATALGLDWRAKRREARQRKQLDELHAVIAQLREVNTQARADEEQEAHIQFNLRYWNKPKIMREEDQFHVQTEDKPYPQE
jgi:hypothetical protein